MGGNGEPKNKTLIMISTKKMQEQASSTLFEFEDSWIKSGNWDCLEILSRLSNSMNLERKIEKGKVNLLKCSFTNVWREYEIWDVPNSYKQRADMDMEAINKEVQ